MNNLTTEDQIEIQKFLSGNKLYGDDFTISQIERWFEDEKDGYFNLWASDRSKYKYEYHQLNIQCGYTKLKSLHFKHALGLGSAYGDEFYPIIKQISEITIIDSSSSFAVNTDICGVPCRYISPNASGQIHANDGTFDLITCLGVLHHIPNVTKVINECSRCLTTGGYLLIREPIVSMGDWRFPRLGLTKRERGIPIKLFDSIIKESNLNLVKRSYCIFPVIPKLANILRMQAYNSNINTKIDRYLSYLLSWNVHYLPVNILQKFSPSCVFYVLKK